MSYIFKQGQIEILLKQQANFIRFGHDVERSVDAKWTEIFNRVVRSKLGADSYEQNLIFSEALRFLGFEASIVATYITTHFNTHFSGMV